MRVFGICNLATNPDVRTTKDGDEFLTFRIGASLFGGKSNFFDVSVFGKQVQNHKKFLEKGSRIFLYGTLQQRRWTTDNGENRSKVQIKARDITYLPSGNPKKGNGEVAGSNVAESDEIEEDIPF